MVGCREPSAGAGSRRHRRIASPGGALGRARRARSSCRGSPDHPRAAAPACRHRRLDRGDARTPSGPQCAGRRVPRTLDGARRRRCATRSAGRECSRGRRSSCGPRRQLVAAGSLCSTRPAEPPSRSSSPRSPALRPRGRIRVTSLGISLVELDGDEGDMAVTVTDAASRRAAPARFERPSGSRSGALSRRSPATRARRTSLTSRSTRRSHALVLDASAS